MSFHRLTSAGGAAKAGREYWLSDGEAARCSACSVEFGTLTRRHHCRACGQIFCWRCSNERIAYTAWTRAEEDGYKEKEKRVCQGCFANISATRGSWAMRRSLAQACTLRKPDVIPMLETTRRRDAQPATCDFVLYTPRKAGGGPTEIQAEQESTLLDMQFDIAMQKLKLHECPRTPPRGEGAAWA